MVKVERPGAGDDTRGWGPPFLKDKSGRDTTRRRLFPRRQSRQTLDRLNLADKDGQRIVRALAARADIVLENFKAGTLEKFGLGYEDLRAVNPTLIHCSITGFGQSGPRRDQAAYDFMIQGMSGLMSVTGEADGKPGGGPQKVGVPIVDIMTGMYAAIAVLAALARRHESGHGEHIDIGMLDVGVSFLANQAMNYLISGKPPRRAGNAHPNIQPQDVFATRDGYLVLAVGNDEQFAQILRGARPPRARRGRALQGQCRARPQQRDAHAAHRRDPGDARARPLGARLRARGRAVRADQHHSGSLRRRADQASRDADRHRACSRAARFRRWPRRCGSRMLRCRTNAPRRCSASTPSEILRELGWPAARAHAPRRAHEGGRTLSPENHLPRIPLFPTDDMTPEQRRVHDAVVAGPRGELRGPLRAVLHRPELADKWQQLGELLRFRTSLPPHLKELAILVTGRHCQPSSSGTSTRRWRAGRLPQAVIDDVHAGRRPAALDGDGLAVLDYAEELNRRKTVGATNYQRVLARWHAVGVVELTALIGYYTMVAMTLNCHDIPLPDGVPPPLPPAPE